MTEAEREGDPSSETDPEAVYETVVPYPAGTSTTARLALTARERGYGGIVCRPGPDAEIGPANPTAIARAYGIDVIEGVEIDASSPESASAAVGEYRSRSTILAIAGESAATNRFAAEEPRIDVLARPMARGGDVDHVIARAAARNGVRIEFDFAPVLRTSGGKRVRALSDLRKLRELVGKYNVPYVVSATPGSHLALRAPRELAAVGETIGFSREAVLEGLSEWGRLAARNRDLQGGSFIEPGVRARSHDEDA